MPATASSYAGLNFIRAAFCPLDFKAMKLSEHPGYKALPHKDAALAALEVGEPLVYLRQFPYTDQRKHRKVGTQIITAPFGLSPVDFDMFLGIFTYLKRLPEIPSDRRVHLTPYFIGKLAGLPMTSAADISSIRSRIFRFSYVKYTNSVLWNSATKAYDDLGNFDFFSIQSMARLTQSRRPIVLKLSDELMRMLKHGPALAFDREIYRSLSPAMRRLYLIANRDGWNRLRSTIYDADQFAVHQLGYASHHDPKRDRARKRDRLYKLRKLMKEAENLDLIRPYELWNGYFGTPDRGPLQGRRCICWSRGPVLRKKREAPPLRALSLDHDGLYDQVKQLHDQHGKPLIEPVYRRLLSEFGRTRLQKHIDIVLAQKEHHQGTFRKSEVATFINRVQNDFAHPDWYTDLSKTSDLAGFDDIQPSDLTKKLYQSISRSS